jgi:hypothetical protein
MITILLCIASLAACKNNGSNTAKKSKVESASDVKATEQSEVKPIVIDAKLSQKKPENLSIVNWAMEADVLEVVIRYSGGCAEHEFNAYFSGSWLKSMPPQAMVQIEHLNPNNDNCRQMVLDTIYFDATTVQYPGSEVVKVNWAQKPNDFSALYEYKRGK